MVQPGLLDESDSLFIIMADVWNFLLRWEESDL
jgi:hypothetical protein